MHDVVRPPAGDAVFLAGGEMGALMREHEWAATPLGLPQGWPQPLKTLVGVMLAAKQPMFLAWGPGRTLLYNDGYAAILAGKQPAALGRDFLEVWHEIRADLLPIVEEAYAGQPVHMDDIELWMERRGYPEETHFAFSYTPVRDEAGEVAGFFCPCVEITEQVLAERRRVADAERQRRLFEQAPGFITILNGPEHVFEFTNATYRRLFGDRAYVGTPVREVFPDLAGQGFFELLDQVYTTGERFVARQVSIRLEPSPGAPPEERVLDFIYEPVANEAGQVTGIFCEGHDVTEAQRSEAALRDSQKRLSFLDQLSAKTAALADADAILTTTTRLLGEHLNVSVCAYADMDEDQDGFAIRGDWAAPGSRSIVGHYRLADFGELAVRNLGVGEPLVVNDNLRELAPEEAATFQSIGIAATICMPLVKEGRLAALMAIHDKEPRVWRDEELGLLREVTARSWAHVERVGALAELRESEAQFRAFAQAVPNHVWAARPDGALHWFNDQVYAYCGELPGSLDGTAWARIVHPDDRPAAAATWVHALATGEVYETEFRIRRVDGCFRWFLVRAEPVCGSDGAILNWVGTNTDIHDRRQAETELREINGTLEQRVSERTADRDRMWRLTTDIMLVARFDGTINAINPAWQRLLGWSDDELLGRPFFELVHPDDLEATLAEAGKLSEGATTFRFENRYRTQDGSYRWVSWIAVPEEGLIHAVGRDITADKEREAELQTAQEALRQSQKMEAVGQLTGGLAHDFNNLLAGISGSLELIGTRLSQGRLTDVERYVTAAQGAARRASALTHRLLAFSRRQTLDPKPTDVNRLVAGIEELIRRTVGPAIQLEVVGASGLWPTLVDPPQLENALLNLCINARDAMPDGGRITIETANKWLDRWAARSHDIPEGKYLSLCVTDTGTGMTPDVIARAFDPFFTTKPIGEGTGLGLSMIYGFAKQSGGQVRIYSEAGEGTTVCIYLPRHHGEAPVDSDEVAAEAEARSEQGETVLVVDDEPTVRMLVTDVLEELGYATIEAGDSVEGLKVLRSEARIDLLVTDVGLPGGMNGRQMADAARQTRPDLKVLFITGYAENAVLGHGQLGPGMHVVTKPFNLDALTIRIRELIAAG